MKSARYEMGEHPNNMSSYQLLLTSFLGRNSPNFLSTNENDKRYVALVKLFVLSSTTRKHLLLSHNNSFSKRFVNRLKAKSLLYKIVLLTVDLDSQIMHQTKNKTSCSFEFN